MAVRRARSSDVEAIAGLATQLGYAVSPAQVGRWLAAGTDGRAAFVAEADGAVVGWAQGHDLDLLQYPRVLEVGGLVVADGARGRGVGKALLDALTDWGRRRGLDEIRVRSNVIRDGAHAFYESLGFERVKTSYTFARAI